jgi:hypothetical protein
MAGLLYYYSSLTRAKRFEENSKLQQQFSTGDNVGSTQPDSEMPVPINLQFTEGADEVSTLADSTIFGWRMGGRRTMSGPSIPRFGDQQGESGEINVTPDDGVPGLDSHGFA